MTIIKGMIKDHWPILFLVFCCFFSCVPRKSKQPTRPAPVSKELKPFPTVKPARTSDPFIEKIEWGASEDEVIKVFWKPVSAKREKGKKFPYQRYRPPEYNYETEETSGIIGPGKIGKRKVRNIECHFLDNRLFRLIFEIDRYSRFKTANSVFLKLSRMFNNLYGRPSETNPDPLFKTFRVDRRYSRDHDFLLAFHEGAWKEGSQEYYRRAWKSSDSEIYLLYSYLRSSTEPLHEISVFYRSADKYLQNALKSRKEELAQLRKHGPKPPPKPFSVRRYPKFR